MTEAEFQRFMSKVVFRDDDCWLWGAYCHPSGYGSVKIAGRARPAHLVLYEHLVGPVPPGFELDHLCEVRACVNPEHVEPVTGAVNTRRGHDRRGRCRRGHRHSAANTHITPRGHRRCRVCNRENRRKQRARELATR